MAVSFSAWNTTVTVFDPWKTLQILLTLTLTLTLVLTLTLTGWNRVLG